MQDLFSDAWMKAFKEAWNGDLKLVQDLGGMNFTANVGYGFEQEAEPRGVVVVNQGVVVDARAYDGQPLNWDLRATPDHWYEMLKKPPNLMGLGLAYTSRKLRFKKGDYAAMIKDPRLADAFVRSFMLMGKVVAS
jgi:hypothetical protein